MMNVKIEISFYIVMIHELSFNSYKKTTKRLLQMNKVLSLEALKIFKRLSLTNSLNECCDRRLEFFDFFCSYLRQKKRLGRIKIALCHKLNIDCS